MGTYDIDLHKILDAAIEKVFQPEASKHGIGQLCRDDLEWEAWPQLWGSTALGYGGIGGQAMTHAQTVIVKCQYVSIGVAVFFGCPRLAYVANERTPGYAKAYLERRMPSCHECKKVQE